MKRLPTKDHIKFFWYSVVLFVVLFIVGYVRDY